MNIVEKRKNRETKKKLKEENIRLKEELKTTRNFNFPVCTVERNIQRVSSEYTVNYFLQNTVPAEIVKEQRNSIFSLQQGFLTRHLMVIS